MVFSIRYKLLNVIDGRAPHLESHVYRIENECASVKRNCFCSTNDSSINQQHKRRIENVDYNVTDRDVEQIISNH